MCSFLNGPSGAFCSGSIFSLSSFYTFFTLILDYQLKTLYCVCLKIIKTICYLSRTCGQDAPKIPIMIYICMYFGLFLLYFFISACIMISELRILAVTTLRVRKWPSHIAIVRAFTCSACQLLDWQDYGCLNLCNIISTKLSQILLSLLFD